MKNRRGPLPEYSYRQSLKKEEVKIYRRLALLLTAVFAVLLIIWFMGTTFLNALGFLSRGTNEATHSATQSLPLLPPKIDKLPEATNTNTLTVSGETTSEVEVRLLVNDTEAGKVTSDSSGEFTFENVALKDGVNLIKVIAQDEEGNTEEASVSITLDKTKPSLAVTTPPDGANYPNTTKTVNVAGSTEPNAIVYVNGSQAVVDSTGKFSYNAPVNAGENPIEVRAIDSAGNSTSVKISVSVDASASQ